MGLVKYLCNLHFSAWYGGTMLFTITMICHITCALICVHLSSPWRLNKLLSFFPEHVNITAEPRKSLVFAIKFYLPFLNVVIDTCRFTFLALEHDAPFPMASIYLSLHVAACMAQCIPPKHH